MKSWSEQITGRKPWYKRVRTYVYAVVVFASFQAGQYYNATRQLDAIGLPVDTSEVREIGSHDYGAGPLICEETGTICDTTIFN